MANCESMMRTNYFKVKTEKVNAFFEFCLRAGLEFESRTIDGELRFVILGYEASIPTFFIYDENGEMYMDKDEDEPEICWEEDFSPLLEKGEYAHFTEISSEKLRYAVGFAFFVTHDGQTDFVSTMDMSPKMKKWAKANSVKEREPAY
jgi:hypothetical protein